MHFRSTRCESTTTLLSQTPLYGQHKTFAAYQNSYKAQDIHADWAIIIFFYKKNHLKGEEQLESWEAAQP